MPKRPCAIDIIPDNQTLIVGDKFGDVYSLPLLGKAQQSSLESVPKPERKYAPSATNKTVHSKANLRALQEQLRQAEKGKVAKFKEPLDFDHELLLGHVAMLTELVIAKQQIGNNVTRTYIITADRDEHIRVSRGPPQSYVTEGYCLGHSKFVSKLCFPTAEPPEILVSGGGDEELRFWDWTRQRLLGKIPMAEHVRRFQGEQSVLNADAPEEVADQRTIVSGLWEVTEARGYVSSNRI